MRTLTNEETMQVSGAGGGDHVKVLSDLVSNFLNGTLNDNSILNDNNILNFVGNEVCIDIL